jgi:hypothetical protein
MPFRVEFFRISDLCMAKCVFSKFYHLLLYLFLAGSIVDFNGIHCVQSQNNISMQPPSRPAIFTTYLSRVRHIRWIAWVVEASDASSAVVHTFSKQWRRSFIKVIDRPTNGAYNNLSLDWTALQRHITTKRIAS